jgi:hypothetical protein
MDSVTAQSFDVQGRQIAEAKQTAVGAHRRLDSLATSRVSIQRRLAGVIASFAISHDDYVTSPDAMARNLCGLHSPEAKFAEKAMTNPAQTTVADWAAELVGPNKYEGLYATVAPQSAFAQLRARGLSVPMAGKASISLPSHVPATPLPSVFVGESQPIPARKFGLTPVPLILSKAAVIVTLTEELTKRSTPATVPLFERLMAEDTGLALDAALFGSAAASDGVQAGLLYGVSVTPPSAAPSKSEACAADLAALAGAIAAASDLVYVMGSAQAASARLLCPGALALSIIVSAALPAKRVVALDAAAFSAASENGTFDLTSLGTLHEEDATPLPIIDAAGVEATPVRSLWQTASIGIRLIEDIAWALRAPGRIAFAEPVTW